MGKAAGSERPHQVVEVLAAYAHAALAAQVRRQLAGGDDLSLLRVPPGARLQRADRLLVSGTAAEPAGSWATHPELVGLVPEDAEATYVDRACLPAGGDATGLEPLEAYSVSFGSTTATARLGPGRRDLFVRMRLGARLPAFARGYADGAADPTTGRIGYTLVDPVAAADLALRHRLPFAVCAATDPS